MIRLAMRSALVLLPLLAGCAGEEEPPPPPPAPPQEASDASKARYTVGDGAAAPPQAPQPIPE
ncbi:hypothetical protein [Tautonia plasticadhaerens]|uniref:Uncharacterized protein n=1 Tax=Tautonia plasticadhaerens TaxID=2527974 RepID=A0A518H524_9BACT|nr:hypothetical protein [Tautonia plasticadhaerens]QDV35945.1 hypothetical protein ElP_38550 [Tautonia plasticadhaerens]